MICKASSLWIVITFGDLAGSLAKEPRRLRQSHINGTNALIPPFNYLKIASSSFFVLAKTGIKIM